MEPGEVPAEYLKAARTKSSCPAEAVCWWNRAASRAVSFKSDDGGQTWSQEKLGGKNNLRGEYLVRLRLGRYAPRG